MPVKVTDPMQLEAHAGIRAWPDVKIKDAFGFRGYWRHGKLFAFITHTGLAVKTTSSQKQTELSGLPGVEPFVLEGKTQREWPVLPLTDDERVALAVAQARQSYEALG